MMDISKQCRTCGKEATKKCTGCHSVAYCDALCQKADWKEHKKSCFPERATCTRCLQVIDINRPCTVSHPPHMIEEVEAMFGRGSATWTFNCKACGKEFKKSSADSNGMDTAPIVSGENFCYIGPHTIKPLKDNDQRRVHDGTLLLYAGSTLQRQINDIPNTMPNVRHLVIQSTGGFDDEFKPSLEVALPKLQSLKLINVAFDKVTLNNDLTPLIEELSMQNIPDECDLTVELPKLKSFSMHYYGPVDNDRWIHTMLNTATSLVTFDSYKLRIHPELNFAGNDLQTIRLHRAECLERVFVYAPRLKELILQACYDLSSGGITILDTHPNFIRPPGSSSNFTVDTTNACINESIVRTLEGNQRVIWSGPDEDDDYGY